MRSVVLSIAPLGLAGVLLVLVAGCDPGEDNPDNNNGPPSTVVPKPTVMGVSPSQLSAGDDVQILGSGFCSSEMSCRTRVTFEGSFQGPHGPEAVQVEAQNVEYLSAGTLRWRFAPNIPFSARGQIGSFTGTVRVFNEGIDGRGNTSSPYPVQMVVGPSIVIRRMGPLNGDCGGGGLTDTAENTSLILDVEAVGLQPGSTNAPLMVSYTMTHANFEFEGCFGCRFKTDPSQLLQPQGAVTLVDRVESGTNSVAGGAALRNMKLIEQGAPATASGSALFDWIAMNVPVFDYDERFALSGFKTRAMPAERGGHYTATIVIQAVDSAGNMAVRTVPMRVWSPVELRAGKTQKVQDHEPVTVTGCIHGSSPPALLTYTDQRTETKTRSLRSSLIGKPSLGVGLGLLESIVTNNARIEAELGIQLQEEVTSAQLNGLNLQVQVLPGQVAMVYRQLTELQQRVNVTIHSACGDSADAGYVVLTDWSWGLDVARERQLTCDPAPPTKLVARRYDIPL